MEIPEIHVVSLDRTPERWARFKGRNAHLKNIVRYPGVDCENVTREQLIQEGYMLEDLTWKIGTIGACMSSIKMWEKAISEDRALSVWEDDAISSYQFENHAERILSALPSDWDIILWGAMIHPLYAWVDLGSSKIKLQGYGDYRYNGITGLEAFQNQTSDHAAFKLLHCFGLHAYSITPKGARAALAHCIPFRHRYIPFEGAGVVTLDVGLDVTMCGLFPQVKAFLVLPSLVTQAGDPSIRTEADAKEASFAISS